MLRSRKMAETRLASLRCLRVGSASTVMSARARWMVSAVTPGRLPETRGVCELSVCPWPGTHPRAKVRVVAARGETVQDALGRQGDVDALRKVHLEDGQEESHRRAADLQIF